jgi:DNA-binding IclR family transcriptional regulator
MTADNSLAKMLSVLDVVEDAPAELAFDAIHARLGYTRSTLYRYLKVLTDAGLLTSLPNVGYTLGPRIIELDYTIRTRDPLINAARPVMSELVRAENGVALLCRRYRHRVLCVHQEQGAATFQSRYERGRARPLVFGAASQIILANLPASGIAKLYAAEPGQFQAAGLGADLAEVKQSLRKMRQAGWSASEGQITPGVTGIAAPIFDSSGAVLGSLSLTLGRAGIDEDERRRLGERIAFCAGIVTSAAAGAPANQLKIP